MLPAWLGVGHALQALFKQGHLAELQAMYEEWPFFTSTFDLIEMERPHPACHANSGCCFSMHAPVVPKAQVCHEAEPGSQPSTIDLD